MSIRVTIYESVIGRPRRGYRFEERAPEKGEILEFANGLQGRVRRNGRRGDKDVAESASGEMGADRRSCYQHHVPDVLGSIKGVLLYPE